MTATAEKVTIVGGGLVGALAAAFLGRRGLPVEVLERRPDMRREAAGAGRSINLAISRRGLAALERVGLAGKVLEHAVPMRGRMVHPLDGEPFFQPYGKDPSECINSLSRATLNRLLLDFAESAGGARFRFRARVTGADLSARVLHVEDGATGGIEERPAGLLLGADGSASVLREALLGLKGTRCTQEALDYGYKELTIPPRGDGGFLMEPNALHIWPRGTFMLIALPNVEGSFTCTLFLPLEGEASFAALPGIAEVAAFFNRQFPDAVPLIQDLAGSFFAHPTGHMVTIKLNRWSAGGDLLLIGDAAHAIVPFFGQGMNCGFEDCAVLDDLMEEVGPAALADPQGRAALFESFVRRRVPDTDAIADMAVENFLEMRDRVADPAFQKRKAVERILEARFPGRYVPRYSLVSFSTVPYRFAYDVGIVQAGMLDALCVGLDSPEEVDLLRAGRLIRERLDPMFRRGI